MKKKNTKGWYSQEHRQVMPADDEMYRQRSVWPAEREEEREEERERKRDDGNKGDPCEMNGIKQIITRNHKHTLSLFISLFLSLSLSLSLFLSISLCDILEAK